MWRSLAHELARMNRRDATDAAASGRTPDELAAALRRSTTPAAPSENACRCAGDTLVPQVSPGRGR